MPEQGLINSRAFLSFLILAGLGDGTGAGPSVLRLADSILVTNGPRCASESDVKAQASRMRLGSGDTKDLLRETSACTLLFEGLQSEMAREQAVIRLLVKNRSVLSKPAGQSPQTTLMGAENPVYMAFILLTGPGVILATVDDEKSLSLTGYSLGLPRETVLSGHAALFRLGREGVLQNLAGQIQANLGESDPARYVTHVVYPYLALLHHETLLSPGLEISIMQGFCQAFQRCKEGNPLRKAVTYYKRLLEGGVALTQPEIEFNRILGTASLHIRCDHGRAELYKVSPKSIPVKKHGIGKVTILERALPFYLGPERGNSIVGDPDVYVTRDHADEFAAKQREFLRSGRLPLRYRPEADSFWRREKIAMTSAKADSLNARLLRMESASRDPSGLNTDFLVRVAIHETRHKWDEFRKRGPRWVTDLEYFAHTSEILFGPLPFHSLLGTIRRMEDFCGEIRDQKARAAYVSEIRALWELAGQAADGVVDAKSLRKSIRKRHMAYATRDGGAKGDLREFEALAKALVAP